MCISPELKYIDTCCLMMFVNEKDALRKDYNIGRKKAESCVQRNLGPLSIPMPALGEAIWMIRDKSRDRTSLPFGELQRLIDTGFLNVVHLRNPAPLYRFAGELCEPVRDERDSVSPMDAQIVAAATVDPSCTVLYTTDVKLISDSRLNDRVREWREDNGMNPLKILDVSSILR